MSLSGLEKRQTQNRVGWHLPQRSSIRVSSIGDQGPAQDCVSRFVHEVRGVHELQQKLHRGLEQDARGASSPHGGRSISDFGRVGHLRILTREMLIQKGIHFSGASGNQHPCTLNCAGTSRSQTLLI